MGSPSDLINMWRALALLVAVAIVQVHGGDVDRDSIDSYDVNEPAYDVHTPSYGSYSAPSGYYSYSAPSGYSGYSAPSVILEDLATATLTSSTVDMEAMSIMLMEVLMVAFSRVEILFPPVSTRV